MSGFQRAAVSKGIDSQGGLEAGPEPEVELLILSSSIRGKPVKACESQASVSRTQLGLPSPAHPFVDLLRLTEEAGTP